ncbi:MAG: NTP transferase domain-containing protein [bacterium]|jgi:bifunctional N-acetylglucosamine-1-phosphate-uridyltransferase/glucosamine-1-phosphate-acetyltransferase GlmU-like protein
MLTKKPQIIIPMSGIGKRFIEAGYLEPKPLIVVDGKPIIQHVVELFDNPEDVIFICNKKHLSETNTSNILKSISPNCKIYEVSIEDRKGPVDAINQIVDFLHLENDRDIIVSYCDYGTVWDYNKFLNDVRNNNYDGAIPCYTGFHPHMLGNDNYAFCKTNKKNELLEIKEKEPFTNNKMNEYASNGTYYFKNLNILKKYFKELVDLNVNIKGEFYVSLVYNLLVRDGLSVLIFEINKMLQWGTPYDLETYNSWSDFFKKPKMKNISCPKNTTLILPMAGNGSRFSEEGYGLPKPLITVDNKPMVIKAIENLPNCDKNVFIVRNEHIQEYGIDEVLKNFNRYSDVIGIDGVTEGQACTCEIGLKDVNLDNPILISACDNGIYYNTEICNEMLKDETIDIIVWSFRNNQTSKVNPNAYAWLDVDDNNNIKHVSCKKFIYDNPLKTHAIIGTMFFRKAKYFIDGLHKNYKENVRTNGEFYVDDILNQNINDNLNVKVFEVEDYICWGTPNDLKTYNYWLDYHLNNNK